jgi:hypothetical protein
VKSRFKGKKWVRRAKVFGVTVKPLACIKLSAYIKLLAETPSLFRQYFLGNTTMQDRVDFWVAASKDKQFQKIGLPDPQDFAFTIPFKIYGDKGPYFKNHGLQLMSVSSLYSHAGNTLKSRLLLCNYIAVRNTVHIFFSHLVGSILRISLKTICHPLRRLPSTTYSSDHCKGNRDTGYHS